VRFEGGFEEVFEVVSGEVSEGGAEVVSEGGENKENKGTIIFW